MEKKQIEAVCPCCATRLTIDVLTQQIMLATPPSDLDETGKPVLDESRWDAAADHVGGRADRAADKLDSAISEERSKEARLDGLFDQMRDKVRERDQNRDFED